MLARLSSIMRMRAITSMPAAKVKHPIYLDADAMVDAGLHANSTRSARRRDLLHHARQHAPVAPERDVADAAEGDVAGAFQEA